MKIKKFKVKYRPKYLVSQLEFLIQLCLMTLFKKLIFYLIK